ncbi:MAG: hypothetical protein UV82_C0011G0028 [Candidatus Magasanikbacteria bacterium GW2011_GWD2_43_18]|uniref:DUF192 domain-containing protein n=1 Tax=Candidatus Magasanikbacteria bacterium GW2011_GWE2_42_7 TaxID=1619052 RepID=A0A0G1BDW8_9BACT|nr:MAG: hypothetical protein UV18_C0007G0030 [Candidatus Magasanikbacteria bacterium GW2011_GWC2_42_27]KKS71384.1 MAG: hypothetical protein UV42_C0030G0002 [Candidatus Magasanikbacteria bacterium GW2011_GWE2_42_7]KKT04100.1 MAG: hypothetical protein UV82_C0011G0028 [Candidatus Magasanikbacteria bacterium GW2011_GWD2_43_18]KKT24707.1 MAG: hypothetical protein UW10_C0021G0005 [Candidatus Magasanikbacteria bacterium GW2011_GWA2_43_9]HBB38538.1 hypothetical protein [Candidatus Magasanikbacteria bac
MEKTHLAFGKKSMFVLAAFFLCFLFLLYWNTRLPGTRIIVLNDQHLDVYVADTINDMYVGLGGREDLGGKDGMLFIFDFSERHGIVMRDMLFPIDIIWLSDGKVVDIAPAVPLEPGVDEYDLTFYRPRAEATMVLELSAGWAMEHGLQIGDFLTLP